MPSPAERMRELAAIWSVQHPELQERLQKALALVGGVRAQGEGVYVVEGVGNEYVVSVDLPRRRSSCTCEDSRRGHHCKHRLAVALLYKVEEEQSVRAFLGAPE